MTDEAAVVVSSPAPTSAGGKAKKSGHGQYGSFVAYCFCVNYILGVGVLSVPHAFVSGGLLTGPLMLLLISVIAIVAFIWIAETS